MQTHISLNTTEQVEFKSKNSHDEYLPLDIRLSGKFLSFYKEIIDAQCFLFYISLLNYAGT